MDAQTIWFDDVARGIGFADADDFTRALDLKNYRLKQIYRAANKELLGAIGEVTTLPKELRAPDGRLLKIKAGMLADALVPIERRTVLEWLFEPLLRSFHESADRSRAAAPSITAVQ